MWIWKASGLMLAGLMVLLPLAAAAEQQPDLDITGAVIVTADAASHPIEHKAAVMLKEEVQERAGTAWRIVSAGSIPDSSTAVIYVASLGSLAECGVGRVPVKPAAGPDGKPAADGYVLVTPRTARAPVKILAVGNDRRGALFAVGRLLRAMTMTDGKVTVPAGLSIASAPKYRFRGHQLGHRSINDTIDAWTIAEYEQYVRDLIVFGANSVEIIPWLTPDQDTLSAVMKVNPYDMGIQMCEMLDSYDMDVWMWLPLASGSVKSEQDRQKSLEIRRALFAKCKRIDHVFVPGGDPGDTPPQILMPYLKDLAQVLRSEHPNAGLWVSTQGFEPEYLQYFYEYLQQNQPDWLTGVVYGPWAKDTLEHTREAVPARYPIRDYPDITHSVRSQYPIPNWDEVWAQTYERQPIMPRPTQYAHVVKLLSKFTDGAICYSDGTNDDVNKAIWSAMLWNPEADVRSVLVQYGRYFIGPEFAEEVADGLLAFEKNWTGSALTNANIPVTLAHWQRMEKRAPLKVKSNWRFQQFLVRAYVDVYVQRRLQQETALMNQARDVLRRFLDGRQPGMKANEAMDAAEALLDKADPEAAAPGIRAKVEELAAALHKSIGMQLGAIYGGDRPDRGAILDTMDLPITDAPWWKQRFAALRQMASEKDKAAGIREILDWENPGPGGFYDDLGNGANGKQPHLITAPGWEKDPGYVVSPQDGHGGPKAGPLSWRNQAETLYWTPLRMRYEGLDPNAAYRLKATYAGRYNPTLQLSVDGQKLGDPIKTPPEGIQVEFDIPKEATADGVLELQWDKTEGRGAQVAEVWLIKK